MAHFRFPARSLSAVFLAFSLSLHAQAPATVVTHATIFTMAAGQQTPIHGYISISAEGRILAVASGDPPASLKASRIVDAHGDWMIPGLISAHSHLWQAAYRGLAANRTLPGWIDDLYGVRAKKASAEDFYWFAQYGALDHLQHGVTTAYTFTYGDRGSAAERNAFEEAQFRGVADSGIRFVHSFSPDHMGHGVTQQQGRDRLKAFLDWTRTQNADPRFLSVMIGGMTAFNDSAEQPIAEGAWMREFHLANQTHYIESADDQGEQRSTFRWMLDAHFVQHDLIFGHFIHADDFILDEVAKAHGGMVWNPLSNGRLASGTPDIPKYRKLGIRVGMGVDGEASADLADPFENMRTGLYAIRAKYESALAMSPYDVLWLHTMGSADVLNVQDKLGSLEPGKYADFLLISPERLGAVLEDPYSNLVLVAGERDIDSVWVGGTKEVEHGDLLHHDIHTAAAECSRRVLAENGTTPTPQ